MEKVRPWCGQPLDREWLRNGTFAVLLPFLSRLSCHSIHDCTAIFLENERKASPCQILSKSVDLVKRYRSFFLIFQDGG